MADLRENAITLLSSTALVEMGLGDAKTTLFTVPAGKAAVITHVVVRNTSHSLVGGTDYDFGINGVGWRQTVSLVSMTTPATDVMVIDCNNAKLSIFAALSLFEILPSTGATETDATATIDVFGYLY